MGRSVPLELWEWPENHTTVNGFYNKEDIVEQMKDLTKGLQAFRIGTENTMEITFHPEDMCSFEMAEPTCWFDPDYSPNGMLLCGVKLGTKLRLVVNISRKSFFRVELFLQYYMRGTASPRRR